MGTSLSPEDLIPAIKEFGHSRVLDGVHRLIREEGLGCLTEEARQALLDRLIADEELSERLNSENRARAALRAMTDRAEIDRIVATAHAHQMNALIGAALGSKFVESETRGN